MVLFYRFFGSWGISKIACLAHTLNDARVPRTTRLDCFLSSRRTPESTYLLMLLGHIFPQVDISKSKAVETLPSLLCG